MSVLRRFMARAEVDFQAIKADGEDQLCDAFIAAFVDDLRAQKLLR